MLRRTFLTGAGVSAGLAVTGCQREEQAEGQLFGRAVAQAPPRTPWDAQWQNFKSNLDQTRSIQLDYFTRGELGDEERMLHDLRRGRAHVGGMSLQGLSSSIPELAIAMAPYLFSSFEEVDYVYDNYLYDIVNELAEAQNLYIIQWVEVGWTHLYADRPLTHPDMAAGLRMRTSPNAAARFFAESAGMDAIPLGITDVVPALQTGLIEGGLSSLVFHFFTTMDIAPDFTLTRHSFDTGAIVLNKAWYESASAEQRAALDTGWGSSAVARAGVRGLTTALEGAMRAGVMRDRDGAVIRELRTLSGAPVRVFDLTVDERAAWQQVTANVLDQLVSTIGGRARDMADAIERGKAGFARQRAPL